MNWATLEWTASLLGLVSVYLTTRQSLWCWPTGVGMVALYLTLFLHQKLYGQAALHLVYLGLQFYGWALWSRGRGEHCLPVGRVHTRDWVLGTWLACGVATCVWLLTRAQQGALVAGLDGLVTGWSLVAQYFQGRKWLECWLVWIGVDVLAVALYLLGGLYPTAVLYAVFLLLAVSGYRAWRI